MNDSAAAPVTLDESRFPDRFSYRGQAVDAQGAPLEGVFTVELRYLDGERELLLERHDGVAIQAGRFRLQAGTGALRPGGDAPTIANVRSLFARHAEVALELRIDGVVQAPRQRVLPAGHSAESRLMLVGRATGNDSTPRNKGYRTQSNDTAVQAATLRPSGAGTARGLDTATTLTHPFELEVEGPWFSQPLRDLPVIENTETFMGEVEEINRPRHESLVDPDGYPFGTRTREILDPLAAASRAPAALQTPTPILNFDGLTNINGVLPPDTEGTVGPNHYVQVVNLSFAIFDKAGTMTHGPFNTNTLWAGIPGTNCANQNNGDAIFNYDQFADRWMLTQFAVQPGQIVCFAVSQTPDPAGAYYLYQVTTPRFPDYFKIGIWPVASDNAYFMATNSGFQNQYDIFAVDRESMLAGVAARPTQFWQSFYNLMMPADVDGPSPPPAGSPGLFYTFRKGGEPYFNNPPDDSLDLWAFDVDWTIPGNSTFTQIHVFTPAAGGFAPFNWSICGFFASNCLDQPGTATRIDSASWWPMQRLAYRNFGDHEAMVGTWTVDVTGTPDLAAPRWFELRRTGGPWSIYQQGTYSPDGDHRWMPSIAMDRDGNVAIGYSVVNAGTSLFPSIRYATRSAGDPLGTLQAEQTLHVGTGAQTHSAGRWGDYSSMTVDPEDDCTFWYTQEYLATTGSAPWRTRIGTFKIPGCGGLAIAPTSQSVCGTVGSVDFDITLLDLFAGTTNLSQVGCPANATCGFTVNPVVFPATASSFEVTGLGAVSAGTYPMTVTATDSVDPVVTRDVNLSLEVWVGAAGVPSLATPPDGATGVARKPTLTWDPLPNTVSYSIEVATDAGFTNVIASGSGLTGTSFAITTNLAVGTTHYWRVAAENPCGSAGASSAFEFTTGIPTVLLVDDDDNAPNVQDRYQTTLNSLVVYDVRDVAIEGEPAFEDLAGYKAVVWFSGDRFTNQANPTAGPQAPAQTALSHYLQNGRCLFLSSQDYAWDMLGSGTQTANAFMAEYLGFSQVASDSGDYTRVDGENVYSSFQDLTLTYSGLFSDFSDELTLGSGQTAFRGDLPAGNTKLGAVSKLGPAYFSTFLAFGLEAMSEGNRAAVLQHFLDTCQAEVPLFADGFESGNSCAWSTGAAAACP